MPIQGLIEVLFSSVQFLNTTNVCLPLHLIPPPSHLLLLLLPPLNQINHGEHYLLILPPCLPQAAVSADECQLLGFLQV